MKTLPEFSGEIQRVPKPRILCDLLDLHKSVLHHMGGAFETGADQIPDGGPPVAMLEHGREPRNGQAGGGNGSRNRLWEKELQDFFDKYQINVFVSHFPPGTRNQD